MWEVTPSNDLLLYRFRGRLPGPDQVPLLRRLHDEWDVDDVGVEAVAYQATVLQEARRDGLPVRELRPDQDKVSRALVAAARLEGDTVWWPKRARWLDVWESELLLFPNGRHDDQADTFAYAATEVTRRRTPHWSTLAAAMDRANRGLLVGHDTG